MTGTPCLICKAPARGAYLCCVHIGRLEEYLADVPWLVEQLEITRSRQDRRGGGSVGIVARSAERPVPWAEQASRALSSLRGVLVVEVEQIVDYRVLPSDGAVQLATWMLTHVQSIRLSPTAADSFTAIQGAVRRARIVVARSGMAL